MAAPPSYEQATNAAATYNQANEFYGAQQQELQTAKDEGIIDRSYLKNKRGILLAAGCLLSLIGYICVDATSWTCPHWATYRFYQFITMFAFVTTIFCYLMYLFKLHTRVFKCACCNLPRVELGWVAFIVLLLLIADLVLAVHTCGMGGFGAACAFGFFALACYIAYGVFVFRDLRQGQHSAAQAHTETTVESPKY